MSDREANMILKAKELELASGQSILLDKSRSITFTTLADRYDKWHSHEYPASNSRISLVIRVHLVPYFKNVPLNKLTEHDLTAYKASRLTKVKGVTVGKEIRTIKAMFVKAIDWGYITASPIRKVTEPPTTDSKPSTYFTSDQLELLYAEARKVRASPEYPHILRLLANTGMRRGEAYNLKWIDVGETTIHVLSTEQERTKSAKWREIPISPGARVALDALKSDTVYVLPRKHPNTLSHVAMQCIRRAKLVGTLHTLRHTFISHLTMKGVSLRTIQRLAGHSSIAITEKYSHLSPDHLQDALKDFSL